MGLTSPQWHLPNLNGKSPFKKDCCDGRLSLKGVCRICSCTQQSSLDCLIFFFFPDCFDFIFSLVCKCFRLSGVRNSNSAALCFTLYRAVELACRCLDCLHMPSHTLFCLTNLLFQTNKWKFHRFSANPRGGFHCWCQGSSCVWRIHWIWMYWRNVRCCYQCVARFSFSFIRPDCSPHVIMDFIETFKWCEYRNCTRSHPSLHRLKLFSRAFITWQQLHAFRNWDTVKKSRWSSNRASEGRWRWCKWLWRRRHCCRWVWSFEKPLLYWSFYVPTSLEFTEKGWKRR